MIEAMNIRMIIMENVHLMARYYEGVFTMSDRAPLVAPFPNDALNDYQFGVSENDHDARTFIFRLCRIPTAKPTLNKETGRTFVMPWPDKPFRELHIDVSSPARMIVFIRKKGQDLSAWDNAAKLSEKEIGFPPTASMWNNQYVYGD
jgi:hypothetical protein